ncbi:MBL fold metallo-hydrolase [Halegenticoccus soli]|uniref:MBL fold metallo-hydrolase n=1 Tax=Halegenticoccus soli TaxID=1985678 RepID=UPI00130429A7|nr:MBL fold metallo-hydrolase [Halegenticoccus soli]
MTRQLTLEYYGLSSFCIEHGETRILVDPWIEAPDWSNRAVEEFADVDYVFVTHGAYDHLGDARAVAALSGAPVITEPAVADHLVAEGLSNEQVRKVIWGNALDEGEFGVRVLETRHLSYFETAAGHRSGLPLGFHFEFDGASLYYVGDTSIFRDLELFVELNEPDVVLLPVGSAPGDLAPMPPRDAAVAASWFDVETIVPVHYVPGSDELDEFERRLRAASPEAGDAVVALDVDDRFEL